VIECRRSCKRDHIHSCGYERIQGCGRDRIYTLICGVNLSQLPRYGSRVNLLSEMVGTVDSVGQVCGHDLAVESDWKFCGRVECGGATLRDVNKVLQC
jgi:hypothetical protein